MSINTSTNKFRVITTTVSGLTSNSKFSDIKTPALVVNTSEGGVFYTDGSKSTLTQVAALPSHTHDYLPLSGGDLTGPVKSSSYIDATYFRPSFAAAGIQSSIDNSFRTTFTGTSTQLPFISTSRTGASAQGKLLGNYAPLIAFGAGDTHGFLQVPYSSAGTIRVGGGNGDSIKWTADLIHSGNIGSQSVASATNATNATNATKIGKYTSSDIFVCQNRPDNGFNIDEIELFGMRDIQPSSEITRTGTFPFDGWGSLMSFNGQNYFVQLATAGTYGGLYFRSAYGSGVKLTDKPWVKFLDSSNYTTYCASVGHTHSNYYNADSSRTKNTVLAAPNGADGGATFRALVAADLPVVTAAKGGSGKTTLIDSANAYLNALSTGTSNPTDADYFISQYAGGGTTTTTYHRRPVSALFNYIKGKLDSTYLPLSGGTITSTANIPLKINTSYNESAANSWIGGIHCFNASLSANQHFTLDIGKAASSKNEGWLGFYYVADGSNDNRLSLGLHSMDDVINIFGSGNVSIGNAQNTTASEKLHVHGNVKATKFIGDVSGNATTATTAASANALGSYTIGNFMTFADYDQYVAAGFEDSNLSQKAVDTYIEFWDSPGWFNSKWGTVTANGGFIGNLTGTATNSNGLAGYTWEATQNSVDTWVPVFAGNKLQYRVIPTAYNGAPSTLSVGSAVITNYIKNLNNINGTTKPYDYNSNSLSIHSIYNGTSTGFPFGYGNLLTICGTGTTQLALEWNAAQTDTNPNVSQRIAIRSQRDSAGNNWSKWTEVLTDGNYTSYCASVGHTHSYFPLAGGSLTGNIIKFANGTELYNESTTSFAINKNSSTRWITINDSGVKASNFITNSDKRLKTNIKPLPTNSKSLELNFYEFDYVNNDNHSAGHIAQEVKEVYPELVHGNESETEHLSIDYTGLHSVQIKALLDRIIKLEEEIKILKSSK